MESKKNLILITLLICFFFNCCVTKNDISGIYLNTINKTSNIDTIKIYKNGTYERFIYDKLNKKLIFKNKGVWKYNESKVILEDFLENYGGYSFENKKEDYDAYLITYFFSVEHSVNGLCLNFNEKMNHYFCKVGDIP